MPISSLLYLPPNQAMATFEERVKQQTEEEEKQKQKDELGWVISSSVDYMITVKQLKANSTVMF